MFNRFFRIANGVFRFIVILVASTLMIYGVYVIADTLNTERNAFVSDELLKYKPADGADGKTGYSLEELKELNPDVVGWLDIYDTNIDYPLVQGEDETKYASHDVFGNSSITGSIYLSSQNSSDFSDFCNIIYGHNMDAGAMFGDIAKYVDEDYFNSHRSGMLYSDAGSYEFRIYSVLEADAYDENIYGKIFADKSESADLVEYINKNMLHGEVKNLNDLNKILIFSTCESAETNGRVIVVADAVASSKVYAEREAPDGDGGFLKRAKLHKVEYWSLLNFICFAGTFFTLLPLFCSVKKYRMFSYSKKVKTEVAENYNAIDPYLDNGNGHWNMQKELLRAISNFRRKLFSGIVIEILALMGSAFISVFVEDLTKRIVLIDNYTPLMLTLFAVALSADIICFTYRGIEIPGVIDALIQEHGKPQVADISSAAK